MITEYYKNLFHEDGQIIPFCLDNSFPALNAETDICWVEV